MGFLVNLNMGNGLVKENTYAHIDTVSGYKGEISISLNYYINRQAISEQKGYLKQEIYRFVPSVAEGSANYHKQGYEYLKTLPEFSGAVDVLEYENTAL